jgi:hypothetical protein
MEGMLKHPYTHHPFRKCSKCDGQGWINNLTYHQRAPWVYSPEKIRCTLYRVQWQRVYIKRVQDLQVREKTGLEEIVYFLTFSFIRNFSKSLLRCVSLPNLSSRADSDKPSALSSLILSNISGLISEYSVMSVL